MGSNSMLIYIFMRSITRAESDEHATSFNTCLSMFANKSVLNLVYNDSFNFPNGQCN